MHDTTSTTPPDIVLFTPTLDGGLGRVTALLAVGIREQGLQVEVWSTTSGGDYAKALSEELPVRVIGTGSVSSAFIPLMKELKVRKPQTLLSASFHANCIAVLALLFVPTRPRIVIADHPSIDAALKELSLPTRIVMRILIRLLYPRANARIAISQGVAEAMSKYSGLAMSDISVIPNPVISHELFEKSKENVEHPFFELDEPVLLYVGRLSPEKDLPMLLQAFSLVNKKVPTRLLLVGDGPERGPLEKLVQESGLAERISFVGHIVNPYPYFAKSDVFVLTSTREGLPTVLIEALALGMQVVSTDCKSGPREILGNGEYGELVPVGDDAATATAIITSLTSNKKSAPENALQQYKTDAAATAYIHILLPQLEN